MNQIRNFIKNLKNSQNEIPWKIFKAVIYWSAAIILLIVAVFRVVQITSPEEPPPTPNLTATLQQALIEAVGPPTETLLPTLTSTPGPTQPPTHTPLPTLTPTITLTPLPTPTHTSTPLLPTLTPALPYNVNEAFDLKPLSADEYETAITRMEVLPELLPEGSLNEAYYLSFYQAVVLSSEALLQYPKNPLATNWRWRLNSHLTKIGDKRASILYATLITQALNNQGIALDNLPEWVNEQDPQLTLDIQPINPIEQNLVNKILELQNDGGSLFLWYVDTGETIRVYALNEEIDYQNPYPSNIFWGDINQDTTDDLIIFTPGSETRQLYYPKVFDLTQNPPKELLFNPIASFDIGLENEYKWAAIRNEQGYYDLRMTSTVYPPCLLNITHTYRWSERWIERVSEDYQVQPISQLLGYCELLVDQASATWGLTSAIQIMEQLLPIWPPESTGEKTYPLDEVDKWRYKLGVYHRLTENLGAARAYFNEIIQTPAVPGSRWMMPAQAFMDDLGTPIGFYKVCVKSDFCDPKLAFQQWVASLSLEESQNALYFLANGGVSIRYTSRFDFEGDGSPERWFTFRHRAIDRLEFWILSTTPEGVQALFVDTVESNQPNLIRYTDKDGQSYVWIGSQQSFRLVRNLSPLGTTIELLPPSYYYAELTNQITEDAMNGLLAGFQPKIIFNKLLEHRDSEFFTCLNKEECARFYYALGLAAEFSGEEEIAIDSYLKIWWDSYESPFSTIARLKLVYKPGLGPIPTATNTPTITPIPTRTTTNTPTATITPTGSTFTPSPTNTEDPNKTNTPTPTATNTTNPYPAP